MARGVRFRDKSIVCYVYHRVVFLWILPHAIGGNKMTRDRAIMLLHRYQPMTPDEVMNIGIPLSYVGHGVFREVYRIPGTGLAMKFPLTDETDRGTAENIRHSQIEARRFARVNRDAALDDIVRVPKIFYYHHKSGVLAVSAATRTANKRDRGAYEYASMAEYILKQRYKWNSLDDLSPGNMGIDKDGYFLLDLGL